MVSFLTICVRYCTRRCPCVCMSVCVVSCEGQTRSFSHTSSPPSSSKCRPLVRRSRSRTKGLPFLPLSISICLSLSSNQSMSSPPPPPISRLPFTLSVSCLPFCFQPHSFTPSFCLRFHLLNCSSASGMPTVIWLLYEFYALTEYNYVQLISWNGS